jgi:hypothetical protein
MSFRIQKAGFLTGIGQIEHMVAAPKRVSHEIVHTMTDYFDGPRGGIADYRGKGKVCRLRLAGNTFQSRN